MTTSLSRQESELIDSVVESFDWEKVKRVFDFLDWRWSIVGSAEYRVPELIELKEQGYRLLRVAIVENTTVSAGGLEAKFIETNDKRTLRLSFVCEQRWENDYPPSFYNK